MRSWKTGCRWPCLLHRAMDQMTSRCLSQPQPFCDPVKRSHFHVMAVCPSCCVSSTACEVLLWIYHKPDPDYKQKNSFYFTCIAGLLVIQIDTVARTRSWKWLGLQTILQYKWATSQRAGLGSNGKGWRGRSAVNFSYCQSFFIMKPWPLWAFESISCKTKILTANTFFVPSPGLVSLKQSRSTCTTMHSCWKALQEAVLSARFFTASFEAQYLTVTMRTPETYAGTLKVNVNSFHKKSCLSMGIDTAGQQEMLSNTCLSSLESESRIWPPLRTLSSVQCFKRPAKVSGFA